MMPRDPERQEVSQAVWTNAATVWDSNKANSWSYFVDQIGSVIPLVREAAFCIPPELASIGKEHASREDDRLVLIFIHGHWNGEYTQTVGRLLRALIDCGALRLIGECGVEFGLRGDLLVMQCFPNPEIREETALRMLRRGRHGPGAYAVVAAHNGKDCLLCGLEDPEHIQRLNKALIPCSKENIRRVRDVAEYRRLLAERPDRIVCNVLKAMEREQRDLAAIVAEKEMLDAISKGLEKNEVGYLHILPKAEDHVWCGDVLRTLGLLLERDTTKPNRSNSSFDRRLAKSTNGVGKREIGEFIAMWGPTVQNSMLEEWSEGKPFWWSVTTLGHQSVTRGGADTRDLACKAALKAIEERQGPETEALIRGDLARHVREYGPYHPSVAYDLNRMFLLFISEDPPDGGPPRVREAEEVIRRALDVTEKVSGRDDPNYAHLLANLALILENTDRKAEAKESYIEAVRILEKAFGTDHRETQEVREYLDELTEM